MAYKEPHFDKAGAKSFTEALGAANAGQIKQRKPAGAKKTPSKPSTGGKGKK